MDSRCERGAADYVRRLRVSALVLGRYRAAVLSSAIQREAPLRQRGIVDGGSSDRKETAPAAGFHDGELRCVARWKTTHLHQCRRDGTDVVDRNHRRKFAAAAPGESGLQSRVVRAGWGNLFR